MFSNHDTSIGNLCYCYGSIGLNADPDLANYLNAAPDLALAITISSPLVLKFDFLNILYVPIKVKITILSKSQVRDQNQCKKVVDFANFRSPASGSESIWTKIQESPNQSGFLRIQKTHLCRCDSQ